MNKSQIKAELRRSACEDEYPWDGISVAAFMHAREFAGNKFIWDLKPDAQRTFFLLVAEAL